MNNIIVIITLIFIIIVTIIINTTIILNNLNYKKNINTLYYKRIFFLRKSELKFLKTISILENEYKIIPKLSLKKIIKTKNKKYRKELNDMTIDYAIFNKDYSDVVLLIELKYKSGKIDNQDKIDKLNVICREAGIKFLTFDANAEYLDEEEIINNIKLIIKRNL